MADAALKVVFRSYSDRYDLLSYHIKDAEKMSRWAFTLACDSMIYPSKLLIGVNEKAQEQRHDEGYTVECELELNFDFSHSLGEEDGLYGVETRCKIRKMKGV